MATKFLDYTGLSYFCSKIKAWCNATFAAITHNQASNTINTMIGYSKPSSGSAIGTSDSLNGAIGKLEAKVDVALDDSNYVHKTGNETIGGFKTFNGFLNFKDTNAFIIKNNDTVNGYRYINLQSGDWNIGSRLQLMDNDSIHDTGCFLLSSGSKILKGSPDGILNWDGVSLSDYTINCGLFGHDTRLFTVANSNDHNVTWSLIYTCGQFDKGTSPGCVYSGSSSDIKLISYPENATDEDETHTKVNIQNLRLGWGDNYWHDICMSPNTNFLWHRDVQNLNTRPWRRIVEENADGITAPNWNISIAGNAATATKLATARSISAGNLEFQGAANFDGSGNINLNITQHRSIVTVGNTNNYPFHRIAHTAIETENYRDRAITFFVAKEYVSAGYGICRIVLRTNTASKGDIAECEVQWLIRTSDLPVDTIQVGFNNTAAASYVDVFYKSTGVYNSAICRVISHVTSRTEVGRGFTVVAASTEASNTTTSDPKTSVESYATITAAGTAIRGKAYTSIITALDSGNCVHLTGDENIAGIKKFTNYIKTPCVELTPNSNANNGGLIDFHYNNDSSDYTSRIIETSRGLLNINGVSVSGSRVLGGINGYTMPFIQGISDTKGNGNSMVYTCGQYSISDMYAGSSTNPQVISFPVNGTNDISDTDKANVQNLRLGWSGVYFHDLFVSPNTTYVWHRNVIPNLARGWRRIVEENVSGVTSPNWNISIAGNAATATKLATARTIFGQSFDGSANIANCNVFADGIELKGNLPSNGGYVDFHYNNSSDDYTSRFLETQSGRIAAYCELFVQSDPDKNMLAQIRINRGPKCFMFRNDGSDFYLLKTADNDTLGPWDNTRPFRVDGNTGLCSINVITPLANSNDNNAANTAWVRTYHSSSSDKRVKQDFANVPNNLLDVWENINWQQYKLINEVKESGDTAPLRFGIVVQDVQELLKDNNIDPDQYGFMYHLKYQGTDGDEPTEDNPEITKADKWYLNYNEALSIEAAYQRRKNKVLERRISELETQVENMLQVLESLKGA